MEHIIQFGVSIDEHKIVEIATNEAAKKIIKNIQNEIDKYTDGWTETKLDRLFKEKIKEVIDENKEEIILNATNQLASNLSRTKAVKEIIKEMKEGEEDE